MPHLSTDEIASMLLARIVREVEDFAATCVIDDAVKVEEIWRGFVKRLKVVKPSTPTPAVRKRFKKATSKKRRPSIQ